MTDRGDRLSEMDDDELRADATPRSLRGRLCLGAVVGVLAGATTGWTICWLVDEMNIAGLASAIGALLGPFGGVGIASFQVRRFPDAVNPDIATFVCASYASLPALLTLLAVNGAHGKITGYLALATAFAFPMGAALVGGLLDRVAEAMFRRHDSPTSG
jgi:hypothetical protein